MGRCYAGNRITKQLSPCRIIRHGLECKKIRAGRKPSSVSPVARGGDHLSGPLIAQRLERSTRKSRTGRPYPLAGTLPYVTLLQAGFSKHSRSPGNLVGSYPTVSPLPLRAVFFSVALSMGSPPVPFRDRLALRSSDFPPPFPGSDHLTRSEIIDSVNGRRHTVKSGRTATPATSCLLLCYAVCLLYLFINGLVRQRIRFLVLLPRDVLYLDAADPGNKPFHFRCAAA